MFHDENRVTGSKAYKQKMPRKTVDYFLVRHMSKFLQMVVTYYLPVTLFTYYLLITTITYLLNVSSNYKSLVHPTRHSYQFSVKKKCLKKNYVGQQNCCQIQRKVHKGKQLSLCHLDTNGIQVCNY